MNQYFFPVTRFSTSLLLALLVAACQVVTPPQQSGVPAATTTSSSTSSSKPRTIRKQPVLTVVLPSPDEEPDDYENLWERIADNLSLQQDYEHDSIEQELNWYLENPKYIDRIANRAAPFLYTIVEEVESRGLPLELALLPAVESAYDPTAYSSEQAAGLWQFIPSTARSFGLDSDWWYDGRRDPLASTRAALDYLEVLNEKFDGNWLLTLAAYNAGEGNVQRALRRSHQKAETADFWSLRLPSETQGHVPRLLAVARLLSNAGEFELELPELPNEPYLEVVPLDFQLDLTTASQLAKVDEELLRTLNAGYLQWATHPEYPQSITLPRAKAGQFRSALDKLPSEQRVAWAHYQIKRGDTLGTIAERFNTRVELLQSVNDLRGSRIVAGNSLLIPRSGTTQNLLALNPRAKGQRPEPTPTTYRVKAGDSLWRIARRFDLRSQDIADWNSIALNSVLHPGQLLTLQPANFMAVLDAPVSEQEQRSSYSVVKGDSLDRIARRFGVTISDLADWNSLDSSAPIFPGQKLLVVLPATELN